MECSKSPSKKSCKCQYGRWCIDIDTRPWENVDTNCPYIKLRSTNVGNFYVCGLRNDVLPGGPVGSPW